MTADEALGHPADLSPGGRARAFKAPRLIALSREYAIVFVVLGLFITLAVTSDVFLTSQNLRNVLEAAAPMGILACALTIVIISGEFDLSIGAIAIISGIIAAELQPSFGTILCFIVAVACATGFGAANGAVITITRINSFVGTLASGLIIAGLGLVITSGNLITVEDLSFGHLGFDILFGIKYSAWIFLLFAVICALLLWQTRPGRWIYAVGGNPEAARLSGISTGLVKAFGFTLSGLAAGLTGIILVSQSAAGQAGDGIAMVLAAFAAVVVGGTSIAGGRGAIWRTFAGVIFLKFIDNGFALHAIDPVYAQIVQGSIILGAVSLDALARRHSL